MTRDRHSNTHPADAETRLELVPADGRYSFPEWPKPTLVEQFSLSRSGLYLNDTAFPHYLNSEPIRVIDHGRPAPLHMVYLPVVVSAALDVGDGIEVREGWSE